MRFHCLFCRNSYERLLRHSNGQGTGGSFNLEGIRANHCAGCNRCQCEVTGVYDIVVKIISDTLESLKEIITRDIRTIDVIRSTMTLIVIE
jgi:hypothetical protein